MTPAEAHVYVHVPFCDGKCAYCGFYSERWEPARADAWLAALDQELSLTLNAKGRSTPETIYVGGGTPTVLTVAQLHRFCDTLARHLGASRPAEWTVEANPGTLTPEKLSVLRAAGVNRLSIGAQSFSNAVLINAGRRHDATAITSAINMARAAGFANIGLDLIAGLPGDTDSLWHRTLEHALALQPQHVSVYALSVESGTRLAAHTAAHPETVSADEVILARLHSAETRFRQAGYHRYEISNYALPGFEARHNLAFWRGGDYLGLGPAASSRIGRRRWTNRADLAAYATALAQGTLPPREQETLEPETDTAERLAFAFRLAEGVQLEIFDALPGSRPAAWRDTLERLSADGLVAKAGDRWRLTERGRDFADLVARDLLP